MWIIQGATVLFYSECPFRRFGTRNKEILLPELTSCLYSRYEFFLYVFSSVVRSAVLNYNNVGIICGKGRFIFRLVTYLYSVTAR